MQTILYATAYIIAFFASVTNCEIIKLHACENNEVRNCAINEVRISPCKEALKDPPMPCKFKKNKNASIEIDFTPEYSTDKLSAHMYWANGFADLPFIGMEKDACKTTACPTVVGAKQTYNYQLKIASFFPLSTYDVKFIFKGDNDETQKCCFIYKIKITT